MECTPQLIIIFSEIKHGVISSQVLTQFEPDKSTFLNIDWSSQGIGWILM